MIGATHPGAGGPSCTATVPAENGDAAAAVLRVVRFEFQARIAAHPRGEYPTGDSRARVVHENQGARLEIAGHKWKGAQAAVLPARGIDQQQIVGARRLT